MGLVRSLSEFLVTGAMITFMAQSALTQTQASPSCSSSLPESDSKAAKCTKIFQLSELERPSTRAADLLAQSGTAVVQVTRVRINQTETGIEVILETDSDTIPQVSTASSDKTLLTDIFNTQLRLTDGQAFRQDNPAKGIAAVTVTQQYANIIRVAVTGTTEVATVKVSPSRSGLVLSFSTPAATAQTSTETPAPEAPTATPKPDEEIEIVVTGERDEDRYFAPNATAGTRTDTPILDVPQSIQVIPQQILEDQQIIRVDDALRNVSGIAGRLDAFGSSTNLTIRGFTVDNFTGGPILRDGFRVYDNLGVQETANLERIEVLKGPASILYGQNDPGGIINLVTKQPLSEPFYELELRAGSFGLIRPTLDISGPLTEDRSLRYRVNAAYQHEDGFRDFDTQTERFFVAPVLSWDISDRTTLTLSLEYVDEDNPFDLGLVAFGNGVVDVPYSRIFVEPDDFRRNRSLTLGYNLKHQFSDNWTLQNGFRYVTQDYNVLTNLPFSFDETTGILSRFYADREYHSDDYSLQTNVVGKFATGSVEHTLLAGVDLNWNRFDEAFTRVDFATSVPLDVFNPRYGVIPRPDFSTVPQILPEFDTEYDRIGVFLQDQISLTDNFILVGSLRYDSVDFRNTGEETSRYDAAWSPP